jgi:tol-pal system protein YbgF
MNAGLNLGAARFAPFAFALLLGLALTGPAQALFGDDEARKAILELRGRVAENDKRAQDALDALARKVETAQRSQLELVNQNDLMRQEMAKLRGQIDTLTNEVTNLQKRNKDLYTDLDARLKNLEPKPVSVDGKSVAVARDEQAAYDAALVLFRSGQFPDAIRSLQTFLVRYPASAYVPSAHYWIGNAYYAQKDYRNAIASQQVVVQRFADTPRAPEALLNIAASQQEMNQRTAARATLDRIVKDYPDSDSAKVAKERLAALR